MYTDVVQGNSPIIFSIPHDGTVKLEGQPILDQVAKWRAEGATGLDDYTSEMGFAIAERLTDFGIDPTVVRFTLDRGHVDPNRESGPRGWVPGFEGSWKGYHSALAEAVEGALRRFGFAFLLDIHGFEKQPGPDTLNYEIVLGTDSGKTAPGGLAMLFAADLKTKYRLTYSPAPERGVNALYRGGYIVRSLGKKYVEHGGNFVQLELHTSLREASRREEVAKDIALAIQGMLQSVYNSVR